MTARELLESCRGAMDEIDALTDTIAWLDAHGACEIEVDLPRTPNRASWPRRDKIPGVDAYAFAARSTGPGGIPSAARNEMRDACAAKLIAKRDALNANLIAMEHILDRLSDATARTILRRYYVSGWTDDHIAARLGLKQATVRCKRNAAVNYLQNVS